MRITKATANLEAYTPGEQPKSKSVVKLNTNENPYPPSPRCAKVLKDFDLDKLRRYPDPVFTALREEIAALNGTKAENVFVGNGSDEILTLAARAFVENDELIASLNPSYSLYKTLAAIRDVKWVGSPTDATEIDIDDAVAYQGMLGLTFDMPVMPFNIDLEGRVLYAPDMFEIAELKPDFLQYEGRVKLRYVF
jgi:histidinol-phosphate aminotransferase